MKLHGNAALSWRGRRQLAERVVVEGWTLKAAAEAAGVSVRCYRKWAGRYRREGEAGLLDRSSAPRRVANRTPSGRVEAIALRVLRLTAAEIAEILEMASRRSPASCAASVSAGWGESGSSRRSATSARGRASSCTSMSSGSAASRAGPANASEAGCASTTTTPASTPRATVG